MKRGIIRIIESFLISIGLMLSINVYGKDYLGFDLCQNSSEEVIKNVVENGGGSFGGVKSGEKSRRSVFIVKEYPVAGKKYSFEVKLYNNVLYEIEIPTTSANNFSDLLDAKYGEPKLLQRNNVMGIETHKWVYKTNDETLLLTYSHTNGCVTGGVGLCTNSSEVRYQCKKLLKTIEIDAKKSEKEKNKKTYGDAKI